MRCYIVKIAIIKSFNKLRFAFDLIVIMKQTLGSEYNRLSTKSHYVIVKINTNFFIFIYVYKIPYYHE